LLAVSHHGQTPASQPGTLSAADPYAVSLPITGIQMSDSSGISGDKQTYLDGTVSNHGNKTVTGITVQVAFQDYNGHPAAIDTMPLTLIRFLKPYVDTVPVSMAPIQPGQSRSFRLIFYATPQSAGLDTKRVRNSPQASLVERKRVEHSGFFPIGQSSNPLKMNGLFKYSDAVIHGVFRLARDMHPILSKGTIQ
jgi:hypothetical protein